jgi:hypothetical protein
VASSEFSTTNLPQQGTKWQDCAKPLIFSRGEKSKNGLCLIRERTIEQFLMTHVGLMSYVKPHLNNNQVFQDL